MNLLLVSYEFPPTWTPQSKRWFNLLTRIAGLRPDWSIEVLCGPLTELYRVAVTKEMNDALSRFCISKTEYRALGGRNELGQGKRGVHGLGGSLRNAYRTLSPLELSAAWWLSQRGKVERFLRQCPDLVITSGPPHATHLWGKTIRKMYRCPWIIDTGDPLSFSCDNTANRFGRYLQVRLEKKAASDVAAIVVTTEATRSTYDGILPAARGKLSVISQGADVDLYQGLQWNPEKGHLVYTGSFYPKIREPFPFFRALLQHKPTWRLSVVGALRADVTDYLADHPELAEVVTPVGHQNEQVCLEHCQRAELLVCIGNASGTQIPGKLYEYLATGIPMLYIGKKDDPAYSLLAGRANVFMCANTTAEISAALDSARKNAPFQRNASAQLFDLSWDSKAQQYANLIESVLRGC